VDRPPLSLLAVGEGAKDLFDGARRSNWTDAAIALQGMQESAAGLPRLSNPDLTAALRQRFQEVAEATRRMDGVATMDAANAITRLVAELSEEYQPNLPYAVTLLGYYGRDLQLGIASADRIRLKQTTADLQQTWNQFEPAILQRGTDDARRFTDILVQLDGATAPIDFVEPAQAELDAVDRLEKMFRP
jgi:hypothetical protein